MLRRFKKRSNWATIAIVLSLICSAFILNAPAQDKPMEANALAALITEFKEVVSKNAPDENDARLIGKRWDARQDLAGKTKSDVIELLYQDVKAVIKDSGVQYQIYSIFSFYRGIPDKTSAGTDRLRLRLNDKEMGTTDDTSVLSKGLEEVFNLREEEGVFREGTNEVEKSVYLAGDRSISAEDLAKLFGVLSGSGASPISIPVKIKNASRKPNPLALFVYAGSGDSRPSNAGIEIGFIGELSENNDGFPGDKGAVAVVVDKNGTYTLDGKQIAASALKVQITTRLKTKVKSKRTIFVQAVNYGNIEDVAAIAHSAGAVKVNVKTKNVEHNENGTSFSLSPAYFKERDNEQMPDFQSVGFSGTDYTSFEITLSDQLIENEQAESEIKSYYEDRKKSFKDAQVSLTEIAGSSGVLTVETDKDGYHANWIGSRGKNGKQQLVTIRFVSQRDQTSYSHYEFLQIIRSITFD